MFSVRSEFAFSEKQVLKVDENTEEKNQLLAGHRAPSRAGALPYHSKLRHHPQSLRTGGYTRGTPRNRAPQIHYSQQEGLVGAVGIEIASLTSKSFIINGVAPPPHPNWSFLEPCNILNRQLSPESYGEDAYARMNLEGFVANPETPLQRG